MHDAVRTRRALIALTTLVVAGCTTPDVAPTGLTQVARAAAFTVATPEFTISRKPAIQTLSGGVASDGTNALVGYKSGLDVAAKLVAPGGTVLKIVRTNHQGANVRVAFGGGKYLLFWTEGGCCGNSVWGLIVGTDGIAVGSPFMIKQTDNFSNSVAYGSGKFLAVYYTSGGVVQGTFVGTDGTVGSTVTLIGGSGGASTGQMVASDGTGFLVVYNDYTSGIWVRTVDADGNMGTPAQVSTAQTYTFRVAYTNGVYLVAFDKLNGPKGVDVYGQFVTTSGALSGPTRTVSSTPDDQFVENIFTFDDNFYVVWNRLRGAADYPVLAMRITSAGVSDASPVRMFGDRPSGSAMPMGVQIGSSVFFAVNRVTVTGGDILNASGKAVDGATLTP
jgi:hypothetical protein